MEERLKQRVNPSQAALIVIDVQNDFCHDEGTFGKIGQDLRDIQKMVPRLIDFVEEARRARVPIIWVRVEHGPWTNSESWLYREHVRGQPICVEGSWGAEYYLVKPQAGEREVIKHRYSAFADTDLALILRSRGIRTILVTGVATNVCCESTAREGFMKDYHVVFVEDCNATTSRAEHEATLVNIRKFFGVVATSDQIVERWRALPQAAEAVPQAVPAAARP